MKKPIVKPDLNNDDSKYWEGVLESHGLGLRVQSKSEDVMDLSVEGGITIQEAQKLGLIDGDE